MPFSIKLHIGSERPVVFQGWIESAFGTYVKKETPFAKAISGNISGFIVTNGPMVLSTKAPLIYGAILVPGDYVASGVADGEDIPYGKPYCVFVENNGH